MHWRSFILSQFFFAFELWCWWQKSWKGHVNLLDGARETFVFLRIIILQSNLKLHRLCKFPLLFLRFFQDCVDGLVQVVSWYFTEEKKTKYYLTHWRIWTMAINSHDTHIWNLAISTLTGSYIRKTFFNSESELFNVKWAILHLYQCLKYLS